jgi:hypothetical protein
MNYQNCARCNQSNPSGMRFCQNCGTELIIANSNLPPTVFGGVNANSQSGQTPPNFPPQSPQNFQQPNFQPPTPDPHQQPPNFQPPNFQNPPPSFQPSYQSAPASGGAKKVLLGIGGILIGFIMLASGGVKLYRAFGEPRYSPTPQNLFSSTNKSSQTPSSVNRSEIATTIATGKYEGVGKNVTLGKPGTYTLRIDQVTAGKVEGYFLASDTTGNSAFVKGTIDGTGKLLLEGTSLDKKLNVAINGTVKKYQVPMGSGTITGYTISAGYAFVDANLKTQSGSFVLSRQ